MLYQNWQDDAGMPELLLPQLLAWATRMREASEKRQSMNSSKSCKQKTKRRRFGCGMAPREKQRTLSAWLAIACPLAKWRSGEVAKWRSGEVAQRHPDVLLLGRKNENARG